MLALVARFGDARRALLEKPPKREIAEPFKTMLLAYVLEAELAIARFLVAFRAHWGRWPDSVALASEEFAGPPFHQPRLYAREPISGDREIFRIPPDLPVYIVEDVIRRGGKAAPGHPSVAEGLAVWHDP